MADRSEVQPALTNRTDALPDMLEYWSDKHGIAFALEDHYPNLVEENGTIQWLLEQYRSAEEALGAVAREALAKRDLAVDEQRFDLRQRPRFTREDVENLRLAALHAEYQGTEEARHLKAPDPERLHGILARIEEFMPPEGP